jgi:adenosylcobinamide-phosphate synthase
LKRSRLLPLVYLVDRLAGDPEWFPHPVRAMGWAVARGEKALRREGDRPALELASGAILTLFLATASYCITATTIDAAHGRSHHLGDTAETLLGWTCMAARNLEQEAHAVTSALVAGNLPLARKRLARIVGRDTADLDRSEISGAVIETLAESASDGVIAPLFYMALGGVPLAMAYKAINTLDSMIGHADARFFFFGKAAARLDDLANLIPSRLTALFLTGSAAILEDAHSRSSIQVWTRDGSKHKSPNAGQPESAMAGALQVRLGGENTYAGEKIAAPTIGGEFPAPAPADALRAIRLTALTAFLGTAALACALLFVPRRRDPRSKRTKA